MSTSDILLGNIRTRIITLCLFIGRSRPDPIGSGRVASGQIGSDRTGRSCGACPGALYNFKSKYSYLVILAQRPEVDLGLQP